MSRRHVFMMFGYVGAGKSYVARWLAEHMQAVHLQADSLRWAMFGEDRPELYTPANKALVNNALYYASEQILKTGAANVIHDAHHNQRHVREKIEVLARTYDARPVLIWVTTPEATAKKRIQSRAETEGHVIFDPNIIEKMLKSTDLPGSDELVIKIDGLQSTKEQQKSFAKQLAAL